MGQPEVQDEAAARGPKPNPCPPVELPEQEEPELEEPELEEPEPKVPPVEVTSPQPAGMTEAATDQPTQSPPDVMVNPSFPVEHEDCVGPRGPVIIPGCCETWYIEHCRGYCY